MLLTPKKSLNKAYLKVKPYREDIDNFNKKIIKLISSINPSESEELHKNLIIDFLKTTYYKNNYFINTSGRADLVIHTGKTANTPVGVIIETKSLANKAEMVTTNELNKKALQELLLYYLRERITKNNLNIKNLIITNTEEWYIFDAHIFESNFFKNKLLIKKFIDFEEGRLAGKTTDFFYKEIAKPIIEEKKQNLKFTYFSLNDYRESTNISDKQQIVLYKIFSPEHLLKLPFVNDSNTLDKSFYNELLHIIGLEEVKSGSKNLITRKKPANRNSASLIEATITQLDAIETYYDLANTGLYGKTKEEQLFNISLELVITWINRILFLKLVEAQLIKYHKDSTYAFLTPKKLPSYATMGSLFFQVLAKKRADRNKNLQEFNLVPYLNSSLFELASIEKDASLRISNLDTSAELNIFSRTVLKNTSGKKLTGKQKTLHYLLNFLNAYDFSSEGAAEIQEENKSLINASVLGLIFEKINGYKDGSFFTLGYVTMYMAKESIRKAAIQKFNEANHWQCKDTIELYNKITDLQQANEIINSLTICDPAVGSGHFLVSALNEVIALKSHLGILIDKHGKRLKEYSIEVVNDELVITDDDGDLFEYNPNNKESLRVQKTIFNEKRTIIENCLFGVDINPNSVKICRLRLWIELLKNTYYKEDGELEVLPNIDINIKTGNSLVSRFRVNDENYSSSTFRNILKKGGYNVSDYQIAVSKYRNAKNRQEKNELLNLIDEIKSNASKGFLNNSKLTENLENKKSILKGLEAQDDLFLSKEKQKDIDSKKDKLKTEIKNIKIKLAELEKSKVYKKAFEWRFEFPEVLNDKGKFIGFLDSISKCNTL